jgi:DNA-binding NtrC family response regulator
MKIEKLSVFVVDDSSLTLEIVKRELQRSLNCHIEVFASAAECLHRLNGNPPDLILSDYYLDALYEHKMNGDQMLSHIKEYYPNIPVIMYSSKNTIDAVIRLMKLGAVDFIPKEKNFIQIISGIALKQIKKLKIEHEQKSRMRSFLLFLAIAVTIWTILGLNTPNLLPYYLFGLVVWIIVWRAVSGNKKMETSKHLGYLN